MIDVSDGALNNHFGFSVEQSSGNLCLRKQEQKSIITDFNSWTGAWNIFYQATLHYHPKSHYKLFSYFKLITDLANKYKFPAVLTYDRVHRLHLAAQKDLPFNSQSISWSKLSDDLFNTFLREERLPQCYVCHRYGHFASACSLKPKKETFFRDPQVHQSNTANTANQSTSNNINTMHSVTATATNPTNGKQQCFRFNRGLPCSKPPCRFLHTCDKCHRPGHPSVYCAHTTTTSFRS